MIASNALTFTWCEPIFAQTYKFIWSNHGGFVAIYHFSCTWQTSIFFLRSLPGFTVFNNQRKLFKQIFGFVFRNKNCVAVLVITSFRSMIKSINILEIINSHPNFFEHQMKVVFFNCASIEKLEDCFWTFYFPQSAPVPYSSSVGKTINHKPLMYEFFFKISFDCSLIFFLLLRSLLLGVNRP